MRRLELRMADVMYERLRKEAFETRQPMGMIVRKAIRLWFAKEDGFTEEETGND